MGLVRELVGEVRARMSKLQIKVAYRSVTACGGVPLLRVSDIASALIEMRGVFTRRTPALLWIEDGWGGSLAIALVQEGDNLKLVVGDEFEVPLEGGITPETLMRFAVSEFGESTNGLIALTHFADPDLPLHPKLVDLDARFPGRVVRLRGETWPLIFRREYYYDENDNFHPTCRCWAMCRGTPVEMPGPLALRGCNLFLRRCQVPVGWDMTAHAETLRGWKQGQEPQDNHLDTMPSIGKEIGS